jgi:hypothetical protein
MRNQTNKHAVYCRDLERFYVYAHVVGTNILWVQCPALKEYSVDAIVEYGYDGESNDMRLHYGVPKNLVSVRLLPPKKGQTGSFNLVDCWVRVRNPAEDLTFPYPRNKKSWLSMYLYTKSAILHAATENFENARRVK